MRSNTSSMSFACAEAAIVSCSLSVASTRQSSGFGRGIPSVSKRLLLVVTLYLSYANQDACIPPERIRHEAVLLESSFSQLVRIGAIERRVVPLERLVDRALSMSTSSPEQLGPLSDQLARELVTQMSPFATDGSLEEVIEFQALIARRPRNESDRNAPDQTLT